MQTRVPKRFRNNSTPPLPFPAYLASWCSAQGRSFESRTWNEQRKKGFIHAATLPNLAFCHSRRWQLYLFPSRRKPEGQSGSFGEPCGLFPELRPLHDLLVSHVWFTCGHAEGQIALSEARGVWPVSLDGHRTPRRPLEGRACLTPQVSEALSGKFPSPVGGQHLQRPWGNEKITEKRGGNYSKHDVRNFSNLRFCCNLSSVFHSLQHYRNRTNLLRKGRMLLYNLSLAATMNIPLTCCSSQFKVLSYKKKVWEVWCHH